MLCPNCHQRMTKKYVDQVTVDHCDFCGGTFFDAREINLISKKSALKLSRQLKATSISGQRKFCPVDANLLIPLDQKAVPKNITLLRCDTCGGIFTFPDDLVKFKSVQSKAFDSATLAPKPALAISRLAVMSVLVAAAISFLYGSYVVRQTSQTRASPAICHPEVIVTDTNVTVICKTDGEFDRSEAIFVNQKTGETVVRTINTIPARVHLLTLPHWDISPRPEICVKIGLTWGADFRRETECVPLINNTSY